MIRSMLFVLALVPTLIFSESSYGEKLLNRLWKDIQTNNVKAIKKYTSTRFQSIHFDGARNREQELELIQTLHIGNYALKNIQITRTGNVFIITYFVEILRDNCPFITPRLTVFKKIKGHWKWIAHANIPVPFPT
jgi:hypothetical protein